MHSRLSAPVSAIIVLLMLAISAWSRFASGVDTNLFVPLAYLHCFGLPPLGLLFLLLVVKSPNISAGFALGIYIFLTGFAIASIAFLWAGSDNSFIFLPDVLRFTFNFLWPIWRFAPTCVIISPIQFSATGNL